LKTNPQLWHITKKYKQTKTHLIRRSAKNLVGFFIMEEWTP
jgi:hypothetical protein